MILTRSFAAIPALGLDKDTQLVAILKFTAPGQNNSYHMSEKHGVYFTVSKVRQCTLKSMFPPRVGLSDRKNMLR